MVKIFWSLKKKNKFLKKVLFTFNSLYKRKLIEWKKKITICDFSNVFTFPTWLIGQSYGIKCGGITEKSQIPLIKKLDYKII